MRAALVSLGMGTLIFLLKLLAYQWTGSAAILSDALESIVNIAAAALATYSVWLSAQPADENHPYGHGKVEDFSAGVEGALIVTAAGGILFTAIPRFFEPRELTLALQGSAVVVLASVLNAALGLYLVRVGKREQSRALEADGRHVLTDVISSGAALVALVLVRLTGWLWLDPLIACFIAAHILGSGFKLIRESVSRLMDEADPDILDRLAAGLREQREDCWVDVHELRTWWAGDILHVDCHLMLPRHWSIERGHDVGDSLEETIADLVGGRASVVVHIDPCREHFCRECLLEGCEIRSAEFEEVRHWDRPHIIRRVSV